MKLTQEYIKLLFNYRNGDLFWKVKTAITSSIKIGNKAGGLNKSTGYYKIKINGKVYYTHRLIFLYHHGYLPKQIDHIDRDPLNNYIENLRESTQSQNCMNRKGNKNSSSKYKDVSWDEGTKKWRTHIRINGKLKHLGRFENEIDAAITYNKAAIKYFDKEYIHLNKLN